MTMCEPIACGRLTRRMFAALPTGCYLVSNVCWAPYVPVFAEAVDPVEARADQWARIRANCVDQRTCVAFTDEAAYHAYVAAHPLTNVG